MAQIFSLYCVEDGVVCGFFFNKGLFLCVKITFTCPALLENYHFFIVKVYLDGWVQFSVDSDLELLRHCVKGEYVCKVFLIKENFKR